MSEIEIKPKKFKKLDLVKMSEDYRRCEWYSDSVFEVYDYAFMQVECKETENVMHVYEHDYKSGNLEQEVTEFWGWVVLIRSVEKGQHEISYTTISEGFLEPLPEKESRENKIKHIIH